MQLVQCPPLNEVWVIVGPLNFTNKHCENVFEKMKKIANYESHLSTKQVLMTRYLFQKFL